MASDYENEDQMDFTKEEDHRNRMDHHFFLNLDAHIEEFLQHFSFGSPYHTHY